MCFPRLAPICLCTYHEHTRFIHSLPTSSRHVTVRLTEDRPLWDAASCWVGVLGKASVVAGVFASLAGNLWFSNLGDLSLCYTWPLLEFSTNTHEEAALRGQMVRSWDFHLKRSHRKPSFSVLIFSITVSNTRLTNAKIVDVATLRVQQIGSMCFHSTLWPGEVSKIPRTSPEWLPPCSGVTGLLNASLQTRFSTSRAKLLPAHISHQTLMDLMWESIITPVTLCGSALFLLRPCHGTAAYASRAPGTLSHLRCPRPGSSSALVLFTVVKRHSLSVSPQNKRQ